MLILKKMDERLTAALVIAGFVFLSFGLNSISNSKDQVQHEKSDMIGGEIIWHVKAIHPEGSFLDIKAFDQDGNKYDVKAIQDADQSTLMDIKVLMNGKKLPVKILQSDGRFMPVKGITKEGVILDIKAINTRGEKMDVKGIGHSGNIIHIKAITKNKEFYGVKAVSPQGMLNDVKGVKVNTNPIEGSVHGVLIHAHVKAISQTGCASDSFIWHIKGIHPEGKTLDIKAIGPEGAVFDVKAIKNSSQRSLLDIKAFIGDNLQLPVKIIKGNDSEPGIFAITKEGSLYEIKAMDLDGSLLDVVAGERSGNLIHIKVAQKNGELYGVKAISPEGELNDVKGVKMLQDNVEIEINGVKVFAHIKALPQ